MPNICFYFQVHQPYRVKNYKVFDIGRDHEYFNDNSAGDLNNSWIIQKVARKCYLPTNKLLLNLLKKHPEFKVSFSFSGVYLDQLEKFAPEVLRSFQELVATGRVEVLSETYYHSLAFLYSEAEFVFQVQKHKEKVQELFGVNPTVFRNTELIYNNDLARKVESMGYQGIIAEGADKVLSWKSPNFLYEAAGCDNLKLLLKNYKLSDDIAFRFSDRNWAEHPLSAKTFADWVSNHNGGGELINLFMDYETFGEHQWEDSGIFEFLFHLPEFILKNPSNGFVTPSEAIEIHESKGKVDFFDFISWADEERDLSAWRSNALQTDALEKVYAIEKEVLGTKDDKIIDDWRKLQTSDHFYYMCTKYFADGDVHKYFNPYETPHDAFISFMNALSDMKIRINRHSVPGL